MQELLHVVPEETLSSVDNPVFVTEKSGEAPKPDKQRQEMSSTASTELCVSSDQSSSSSHPPPYEEIDDIEPFETIEEQTSTIEEDDKIVDVLKEIVKKTTVANPLKRPSAYQVVIMLEEAMPKYLLKSLDMFDVSDDDDNDDDDDDDDDDTYENAKQL